MSSAQHNRLGRAGELLLPAVILGVLVWTRACTAPLDSWAQPRLAAAYALAQGQPLYPDLHDGAQLCWLYGPGFAIWMLPVTFIPSLAWAEAMAVVLNALAPLGALLWCLRADAPDRRTAAERAGWVVLVISSAFLTGGWFGGLHVDPLCIAFMLLSLGAARRHLHSGRKRWLLAAALGAALAVWTKQTAAAFPLVLAAHWARERRWSLVAKWSALVLVFILALSALVIGWFGLTNLWFYVVTIHPLLPWRDVGDYFAQNGRTLLFDLLPWLALAALPRLVRRLKPGSVETDAGPYLWLGLALLPFGLAAALKEGGGVNSAHGLFFLAVAIGLRLHALPWGTSPRLVLAAMLGLLALSSNADRLDCWRPSHYQDDLLASARAHPNKLYLPWNPLVTLITDRKIYPFEYALFARELTGTALTPAEIRAALPTQPIILYDPLAATRTIKRYLPEARPVTLPMLKAADSATTRH